MADARPHAPYLWLDKTVLITGAGQRAGQELGELLAGRGARVWLGAKEPEAFDQLVDMLRARCRNITAIALDIADDESIAEAVAEVGRREGRIDVLINIADATSGLGDPASGHDTPGFGQEQARECLETHFVGPWLAAQHALPLLWRSCSAMIVNVTSCWGRAWSEQEPRPGRDASRSRAPKAGPDVPSRLVTTELRMEIGLRKNGAVRVFSVVPDASGTGMAAAARIVAAITEPSSSPEIEAEAP